MEDSNTALLAIVAAFVIILLTFLIIWANRDTTVLNNKTQEFIVSRKCDTEAEIAKFKLEGQKLKVEGSIRESLLKCQTAQDIKKMEVGVESERLVHTNQSIEAKETGKNIRDELQCKTALEMSKLDYTFKNKALDAQVRMFSEGLTSKERLEAASLEFGMATLAQREKESKRGVKQNKFLAELNQTTNEMIQEHESARFRLGCSTSVQIAREKSHTAGKIAQNNRIIAERQIQGAENMFERKLEFRKIQEFEKSKRCQIKADSAAKQARNNPLNALAFGLGHLASTQIPALAALKAGSGILESSLNPSTNEPIVQEME
jgi:hypothetical protein